ncbi:MAG: hypothetical protein ACFFGZ_05515 [Candidatus Thorarchaeota archaeon]
MPQIVKGGKYVFGWSTVDPNGKIVIPQEALEEYNFLHAKRLILIPGSKKSGGFGLSTIESLAKSRLSFILDEEPQFAAFQVPEGEIVEIRGKPYCWAKLLHKSDISVSINALERYGIYPGSSLLSVRGSHLAIGFLVRGPIFEEAKNHSELEWFS